MKVAVTGGKGFIGQAVVNILLGRGHLPTIVDRNDGVDVLGSALAESLMHQDAVIHLAGVLGTEELFQDPDLAIDVNVKGTARVLQLCGVHGLRYVGITMPEVWDNVYQATKHAARRLASAWHRHYGVPVSHVRAFNVYGPGQKVGPPQKIVPTFADRAWKNKPIPIWGTGDQWVDLVHVSQVAQMLVDALNFGDDEVFDAGTGKAITVNTVADIVLQATASTGGVEELPMRKGEHFARVQAEGEGWDKLGWHPELNLGRLVDTVNWYRPHVMIPADA